MTTEKLVRRLDDEGIVALETETWTGLEGPMEEVERHPTYVAGDLLILRVGGRLVAVEEPSGSERVVRLLADDEEARRFVRERMETYDRMFDGGCGCKVDYYR